MADKINKSMQEYKEKMRKRKTLAGFFIVTAFLHTMNPGVQTPLLDLFQAARDGDLGRVKLMLEQHPELIDRKRDSGWNLLHYASMWVEKNQEDLIKLLLSKGADVNATNNQGKTALHLALMDRNEGIAAILLKNGADVNIRDESGWTSLYYAVKNRCDSVIDLFLKRTLKVDSRGEEGRILLHGAATCGHRGLVDMMIAKGAAKNSKDRLGGTLLHNAAIGGLKRLVGSLITSHEDISTRNIYGLTPLHLAAMEGRRQVMILMIEKGGKANEKTFDGKTSYHLALENGYPELSSLLKPDNANSTLPRFPDIKGPYLGQKPPGASPEVFAPGIVSTLKGHEFSCTFSPEGDEMFFTRRIPGKTGNRIMYMNVKKGRWTRPRPAPFFYDTFEFEPNFSPDGKKVFYGSRRPLPGQTEPNQDTGIWIAEKGASGWGPPYPIGSPVSEANPMFLTATHDGTIYYTGNVGRGIYRSRFKNGRYTQPERLPDEVNFIDNAGHPYIAPDESYVIFDGYGGPGSQGSTDLYVSFRGKNDTWSRAVNMGPQVNSKENEICATVSFDGKYLFYLSTRNGNGDIYWLDTGLIKVLSTKTSPFPGKKGTVPFFLFSYFNCSHTDMNCPKTDILCLISAGESHRKILAYFLCI